MSDTKSDFSNFQDTKFFVSLDALRCFSILAVIWHHAAGHITEMALLTRGYLGVDFFFVISGFLITTLLLREREKHGCIDMRSFYMRRSLRIFPLYYGVILLYVLVVGFLESNAPDRAAFFANVPYFLTYTSNLFVHADDGQRVIFYFAWSLATEEQFYLLWPWIERYGSRRLSIGIAGGLLVAHLVLQMGIPVAPMSLPIAIFWHVAPAICLGVLLAHGLHAKSSFEQFFRVVGGKYSCLIWLVVLLGSVQVLDFTDGTVVKPMGRLLVATTMMLVVASFVIRQDHVLAKWSRLRPLVWIGTVSYGVYLLHLLALNVARAVLHRLPEVPMVPPTLQLFLVTTFVSVIAATVSFLYFEAYFNRLKSRFSVGSSSRFPSLRASPAKSQN